MNLNAMEIIIAISAVGTLMYFKGDINLSIPTVRTKGVVVYVIREPADIKRRILTLIRADVTNPSFVIVIIQNVYKGVPVAKKIFNIMVKITMNITGLSPFRAYLRLTLDTKKADTTKIAANNNA